MVSSLYRKHFAAMIWREKRFQSTVLLLNLIIVPTHLSGGLYTQMGSFVRYMLTDQYNHRSEL